MLQQTETEVREATTDPTNCWDAILDETGPSLSAARPNPPWLEYAPPDWAFLEPLKQTDDPYQEIQLIYVVD